MTYPASGSALVSLPDVFAHLQMDTPPVDGGAELQGFIDAATAFVEFQTGPIIPKSFTEVHSGGGHTIALNNPPVLSVESVVEFFGPTSYTLLQAELGTDTGQYSFSLDDPAAGIICRRYAGGVAGPFMRGYRNVQVTYTAGRTSVPADVRMAALEDIRGLFTQTQYSTNPVAQMGAGRMDDGWGGGRSNPIGAFPRLAALLAGPSRTPSIA